MRVSCYLPSMPSSAAWQSVMRCNHTGLPTSMCGHCNGSSALVVDPITGMRQDEEPHQVKGVWKGMGRSMGDVGSQPLAQSIQEDARFDAMRGKSDWAKANRERTLKGAEDVVAGLKMWGPEIAVIASLGIARLPAPTQGVPANVDKQVAYKPNHFIIPKPPKYAKGVCGHARKQGKAATLLYRRRSQHG